MSDVAEVTSSDDSKLKLRSDTEPFDKERLVCGCRMGLCMDM